MARINIPLEALTSRLNLSGRFDSVGSQSLTSRFANLKPISEFLNIKRISKPRDFGEVQSRVNYNLSYFSSNYAVVFVMLSIYSLLNNLKLTFAIVLIRGHGRELRELARPEGERFEEVYSDEEEDDRYHNDANNRNAYYEMKEDDDVLVRAALERIYRARTRGKTNVSLTMEEMEALARRHPHPIPKQEFTREATPPGTPKSSKAKLNSKSNSLSSMLGGKTRKKSSSPAAPKPTTKSNTKAKIARKLSTDGVPTFNGPSVLVQGPDGLPMYAPLATYPPEYAPMPRSRSRSTSQSKRESTPPEQMYSGYPMRFYPVAGRPASSGSMRHSDEQDVSPRRNRSGSSAAQYRVSEEYSTVPAVHGRRNFSGPPDIAFSTLRRVPAASSPLVPRPAAPQHSNSDPSITARKYESSSNSGEESVQVEIVPDADGSYSISRTSVKDETRRRKNRK